MTSKFRAWITGQVDPDKFIPAAYGPGKRELHDDWPPGFRWIPRNITFYPFPMPAIKFWGTMQPDFIPMQQGYPAIGGTTGHKGYRTPEGKFVYSQEGTHHIYGYHPVPKPGQWIILGPYIPPLGFALPLYFSISLMIPLINRRFHFNMGFKPDVTLGDNGWNFPEASLTLIKLPS